MTLSVITGANDNSASVNAWKTVRKQKVQMADKAKLFPFKLDKYKVKKNVWCNYWIATPAVFDDYCTNYLSKAIEFFKGTELYERTEKHRGKQYLSMTFFLEGLFSVYLTEKNL